ncbi:MAG TPA: hypothetical protein VLI90_11590 [Tepidisphaeraceae bacterium]|nr:hypothetical protein [Tepidisphaeraceae bacterium]
MERDRNASRKHDDGFDTSQWGQTILWLCILLLTAAVVASAANPPAAAAHAATYTDGKLSVTLTRVGNNISGTVTLNGQTFPLKATADKNDPMKMFGSFTANGKTYQIAMGVPAKGQLNFKTGTTLYHLSMANPGADNPLVAPATPQGTDASNPLGESAMSNAGNDANSPLASATTPPSGVSSTPPAPPPVPVAPAYVRPTLRVQQGQYFRWSQPEGWRSNETTNGVDVISPDGRAGATSCLLVNTPGTTNPQGFVQGFLPRCGAKNIQITAVRDLPDQMYAGAPMKTQQMELTYDVNGTAYHGLMTCAVVTGFNNYTAFLQGAASVPEDWDKVKTWLPAIAENVSITNPQQVAMQDKIILPKNRPLDDTSVMSAYQTRAASQDRMSQKWEETALGYERMKDPGTGQMYDMPFEAFDAARGGYVNPQRPTDLLQHAQAGE